MYSRDELERRRDRLSPASKALLQQRLRREPAWEPLSSTSTSTLPLRSADEQAVLSFTQERLWFLQQLAPESAAYNEPLAVRLRGQLKREVLTQTLAEIVRRHEVLRTIFPLVAGVVQPIIQPPAAAADSVMCTQDLRAMAREEREAYLAEWAKSQVQHPFSLAEERPWRVCLVQLDEEEYVLLLVMHHIITDAWSLELFVRELTGIYTAIGKGLPAALPPLPLQYTDYACWQRKRVAGSLLEEQAAYWRRQLAGDLSALVLPVDRPRQLGMHATRGRQYHWCVPAHLCRAVQEFCRRETVTPFILLLAAFYALLYRYSGQEDLLIGTSTAGRSHVELEHLLGCFINMLPLRVNVAQCATFRDLLRRVRTVTLEAYEHQDIPFEQLSELLRQEQGGFHGPSLQAMCVLQNMPIAAEGSFALQIAPFDIELETCKFDLSLVMRQQGQELSGYIEYNCDLFDPSTIERMQQHYLRLLECAIEQPDSRIQELELLRAPERQQMLVAWNPMPQVSSGALCLHHFFELQVERDPQAPAVLYEDETISYEELNRRANRLAHYLRRLRVGPEVLVGVCIERSPEMLVAVLGIVKAGGAYVPLDTLAPRERLTQIVEQARLSLIVTQQDMLERLPENDIHLVCLDREQATLAEESAHNLTIANPPESLAYVIFTSGSTGTPKGVSISHTSVSSSLLARLRYYEADAVARLLLLSALSFDASVVSIFWTLSCGGALVLPREHLQYGVSYLLQLIERHHVSHCIVVPSLYQLIVDYAQPAQLERLRVVVVAAEVCQRSLVQEHYQKAPHTVLFNEYGPTEATVWSSVYRCSAQDSAPDVPIGFPIDSAQLYVLDDYVQPVPIGVVGELYIGGAGVARGYLGSPGRTSERFVPHPFSTRAGERLYKTGDLVKRSPDGALHFLGRADRQVKIRGYRIEPGEVEQIISEHTAIRHCAITVREDRPGEPYLLCYLVLLNGATLELETLQRFLAQRLPLAMHPAAYMFLEQLPLRSSGKIDYARLPAPAEHSSLQMHFVAARDPVEEMLVDIWAALLGVERVSTSDGFFRLGGHSLLAARMIARVRAVLGVELTFQDIVAASTVARLSTKVRQLWQSEQPLLPPPLRPMLRDRPLPLAFSQQRQWLRSQLDPTNAFYTIFGGLRLKGRIEVAFVERALQAMIDRHEPLRTTYHLVNGHPVQRIAATAAPVLAVIDVRGRVEEEREAKVQQIVAKEKRRAIHLSEGPMLYVTILQVREDEALLLFTSHHIIFDGWSVQLFLQEFAACYLSSTQDAPSHLPALPLHYADYVLWQQEWLQGPVLETLLTYWKRQLAHLPTLALPGDRPRPLKPSFGAATLPVHLAADLVRGLKELGRREGATLFMTLLAAFQCVLARYSGQEDITVGTPTAHRGWGEVEGLIGNFTNTQVLRTDLSAHPTLRELLARVRHVTLQAHTYQALPFEIILNEVPFEHHPGRNPLYQALFALQNSPHEEISLPGIEVEPLANDSETTLFDVDLSLEERGDEVYGGLKYSTDLFDAPIITRMRDDFLAVLEAFVSDATQRIADISYLSQAQQRALLQEWNRTQADYANERCIHELFEAQVERAPTAPAVVFADEQLSYQQVNWRANQIAHHLRGLGIGPGVRVAICMDRSLEMIPALLGILKAGATYVPCEPAFPKARLQWILSSLSIPVLLTQSPFLDTIRSLEEISALKHVLCLDRAFSGAGSSEAWATWTAAQLDACPIENLPRLASAQDIAYIIFTSGSTGYPKGVMVRHQPVINLIEWVNTTFQVCEADRLLFITSLCFDLSVYDIFGVLAAGGSLEMVANADIRDPERLLERLYQGEITFWDSAPAALQQLVPFLPHQLPRAAESKLRLVFLSGDWIPITLPDAVRAAFPAAEVVGLGGATEATVWSNYFRIGKVAPGWTSIPYGRPIQNAHYYILDAQMQPCQVEIVGDLYIGGLCLAEGYVNQGSLTAERFLPDPFAQGAGGRLYKTGDLARFWSDGTIEFLGRSDTQVKIRGFRIELGEIEAALMRHPAIQAAVVEAPRNAEGERFLAAYIVMEQQQEYTVRALRQYLQKHLPEYMLPSVFIPLSLLPLTPNGKVDRNALPAPDSNDSRALLNSYEAPETPIEEELAAIWASTLHLPRVGRNDNFFEIGGHSLLSIQVLARMRATWQVEIPLRDLFETQTIAELATRIEQALAAGPAAASSEARLDLQQEARLDADIEAPDSYEAVNKEPEHIFLSGASGFLGSVLLAELLAASSATLYCLVRSGSSDEGRRRVQAALEKVGCWQDAFSERIVPVPGDLALPRLGLTDERFAQLGSMMDVVYHCGALTSSVYQYHDLKASNVGGTQEMLRLTTAGKIKPFHYISTLSVLAPVQGAGTSPIGEEEPLDAHQGAMQDGYMQSKWVAEKLVTIASARGVPCSIYRPGRITGHSQSGAWPTDDILCRRLKGCIQLGAIPRVVTSDLLEMTPVDYVARAVVALSRRPQGVNKTYHLSNPSAAVVGDIITWINNFGYTVQQVSYTQWLSSLKQNAADGGDNVLVPFLALLPNEVEEEEDTQAQAARVLFDDRLTREALGTTALACAPIDEQLLNAYLSYFVRCGFLPAPAGMEEER